MAGSIPSACTAIQGELALHKALIFIGDVFIVQGDAETAYSLFTVALGGFVYMDVHYSQAQCLLRLGVLASKRGNFSHATNLWTAARPLFERSLQAKDVAQIDARLAELGDNQKVLMHLAALHPPETAGEELSVEVKKARIKDEVAASQNLPEERILSNYAHIECRWHFWTPVSETGQRSGTEAIKH
ncbi:hypothetical protein B0H13DRAFT_1921786 [Mycena leptocephala]|nr:hypothetical protein B0H13DRAFT_1921786 [Mycena leptocephala]